MDRERIDSVLDTVYPSQRAKATISHCPLLDLPGEIRNTIYEHVFRSASNTFRVLLTTNRLTRDAIETPSQHCLALTETCKQIRSECNDLFFELNEFTLFMPILTDHERYGPASVSIRRKKFNAFMKNTMFTTRLQHVHLTLGSLRDTTDFYAIWFEVADVVLALLEIGVTLRVAFCLSFGRYQIPDIEMPCYFAIGSEYDTAIAMDECFSAADMSRVVNVEWVEEHFRWIKDECFVKAVRRYEAISNSDAQMNVLSRSES